MELFLWFLSPAGHRLHKFHIPLLPAPQFHLQCWPAAAPQLPGLPCPALLTKSTWIYRSREVWLPHGILFRALSGKRWEENRGKVYAETLHPLNGKSTLWMRKEAGKEATPSSQATVSGGPAQVLLALCPMAGHSILINKCPCQLPSHRNACHSRAELARAKLRKGRRQPARIQPLSCTIQIINTPRSFLPSSLARGEKSWE